MTRSTTSLTNDEKGYNRQVYYFGFESVATIGPLGTGPVDFESPPFHRENAPQDDNYTWTVTITRKQPVTEVRMLRGVPPRVMITDPSTSVFFIRKDFAEAQAALLRGSLRDETPVSCIFDKGRFDYVFGVLSASAKSRLKIDWSRSAFVTKGSLSGYRKEKDGTEPAITGEEVRFSSYAEKGKVKIDAALAGKFIVHVPTRLCFTHPVPGIIMPFATIFLYAAPLRSAIESVANPGIVFLNHEVPVLTPAQD